ncbi:MAG: hypothetical protein J6J22_07110 [Alistipes sp.]|nr:hypothetical protein [Alistipes sp.]MBP3644402.1 hypothetical protein [Alistipes sp.]
MTLKQRVKTYCDYKNIAITNFERKAGLSNGYFRESSNRMSDEKAMKIQRAFDDLNIDWLRTGNGEMLQQRGHTVIAGDVTGNGNNFVAGNNNHIGVQGIAEDAEVLGEQYPQCNSNIIEIVRSQNKQITMLIDQIDKLVDEIGKNGERESRLISLLEKKY